MVLDWKENWHNNRTDKPTPATPKEKAATKLVGLMEGTSALPVKIITKEEKEIAHSESIVNTTPIARALGVRCIEEKDTSTYLYGTAVKTDTNTWEVTLRGRPKLQLTSTELLDRRLWFIEKLTAGPWPQNKPKLTRGKLPRSGEDREKWKKMKERR